MKAGIVFLTFTAGFVWGVVLTVGPTSVGWLVGSIPLGLLIGFAAAYVQDRERS